MAPFSFYLNIKNQRLTSYLSILQCLQQLQSYIYHLSINKMYSKQGSYFAKHKKLLKQPKQKSKQLSSQPSPTRKSIEQDDHKVQEIVIQKHKSNQAYMDIQFDEKSQDQKVYEQYKEIKSQYDKQLQQINKQILKLRSEAQNQSKKIKQAEISLQSKKKDLKATMQRYQQMKIQFDNEEQLAVSTDKIIKLEKQIAQFSIQNVQKINKLNQEHAVAVEQNKKLQQRLRALEQEYQQALQFDKTSYEEQKTRLEQEQETLKQQLQNLQQQSQKIKKDIERVQNMKPISGDVHKKYLDLFQKTFMAQQLAKAQKIMNLKQEERKYSIQHTRRKQWLKQKQKQIQQRQARVAQKNKIIDKLTNQIRQKSTLLLTKFQAEADKHRK